MKTLANQFVLDVFVIIERAINGIVLQHDVSHSFIYQWWHLFSSGTLMMSVFFVTHQCICRLLFSSASCCVTSAGCMAALHCIVSRFLILPVFQSLTLLRFYCCALHSVCFRIILLNIFADGVLRTSLLENDWSYLQAWYWCFVCLRILQFTETRSPFILVFFVTCARNSATPSGRTAILKVGPFGTMQMLWLVSEYLSRFCQVGVCPISTSRGMQFSAATIAWCPGRCRCRFFVSFGFKQRAIGLSHFSYFFF